MSKNLKEFMLRQTTGQVDLEFDDDSTQSYNMRDVVTATSDPVTGGVGIGGLVVFAPSPSGDTSGDTDSSALQKLFANTPDGAVILFPSSGTYYAYDLTLAKRVSLVALGSGYSWASPTQIRLAKNSDRLITIGQQPADEASLIAGIRVAGIQFDGAGKSVVSGGVILKGLTNAVFENCSISGFVGKALPMYCIWQANFKNVLVRNNDASSTTGVVTFEDVYAGNQNLNCNVIRFIVGCQIEGNKGTLFYSSAASNLDDLEVSSCEFENGYGASGTWTALKFLAGSRISFHDNEFARFYDGYGYSTLLSVSDSATANLVQCVFHRNTLHYMTNSTNILNSQGKASVHFYDNTVTGSSGAVGNLNNGSQLPLRFEYPRQLNSYGQQGDTDAARSLFRSSGAPGFISVHECAWTDPQFTLLDSNSIGVAKTVYYQTGTRKPLVTLPKQAFVGMLGTLNIAVRCKSASGTGPIGLYANTTYGAEQNAGASWGVLKFQLTQADLATLMDSASNRLYIVTGAANATTIYVDGIWLWWS